MIWSEFRQWRTLHKLKSNRFFFFACLTNNTHTYTQREREYNDHQETKAAIHFYNQQFFFCHFNLKLCYWNETKRIFFYTLINLHLCWSSNEWSTMESKCRAHIYAVFNKSNRTRMFLSSPRGQIYIHRLIVLLIEMNFFHKNDILITKKFFFCDKNYRFISSPYTLLYHIYMDLWSVIIWICEKKLRSTCCTQVFHIRACVCVYVWLLSKHGDGGGGLTWEPYPWSHFINLMRWSWPVQSLLTFPAMDHNTFLCGVIRTVNEKKNENRSGTSWFFFYNTEV